MEDRLGKALAEEGDEIVRAHPFDKAEGHGFIASQRQGMDVFATIPPRRPARSWPRPSGSTPTTSCPACRRHRGPILTVANWSGSGRAWSACSTSTARSPRPASTYSTLWSEDFTDAFFQSGSRRGSTTGTIDPRPRHVTRLRQPTRLPRRTRQLGAALADELPQREGDHGRLRRGLHGHVQRHHPRRTAQPAGVFKERLSQSALCRRDAARSPTPRRRPSTSGSTTGA